MRHFLFEDLETGEIFIVEEDTPEEAEFLAEDIFVKPIYLRELTDYEAECSWLDKY